MKLVVVESPSKAKTIAKYLGKDYLVYASGGHINDLPERRLGINVEKNFEPEYEVNPKKEATISKIKKEIGKCDKVYLATDPDREGEAISWHLKNVLGIKDNNVRIVFNEISKKAVNKAIETPREIDLHLVDSQQARRILDRLVGYKVSPVLSKKIKSGLSAGRVQSVALRMIVEKEREIRAFKPEEYWNMFAFLTKQGEKSIFKSAFSDIDDKKYKIRSKEDNDAITQAVKGAKFFVDKVKRATSISRTSPAFTTSTLQQDASHKLGISAPEVMKIAQQLYEGVEIAGEGQVALVTYIRTDSVRISEDAQNEARSHILATYGKDFVPDKPKHYVTSKSAQDAHEAIRPINVEHTPESLKDKIHRNQYRLYKLIYERFLASQMTDAEFDTLNVHIKAQSDRKYGFTLKGKTLKFAGYTILYNNYASTQNDDDEDEQQSALPDFNEGEPLTLKELKSEQKFTKPPARYNDATLVKALEENGIGRPSTYASIITVIAARMYTEKEGRFIKPTELGEIVCDQLVLYFPDIFNTSFTAEMEKNLDVIAEGGVKWQQVLGDFYPSFAKSLNLALKDGNRVVMKLEESDVPCEKCGAMMVIRDGKFGKFLACPNFPTCRNTRPIEDFVAKCPVCGSGIIKRFSKKGKVFYGCSSYPKCDFISWDVPAPHLCPDCKQYMKLIKNKEGTTYKCSNKECGRVELVPTEDEKPED